MHTLYKLRAYHEKLDPILQFTRKITRDYSLCYLYLKQSPAFSFGIWIIDAHGKYVEYQELWIADDNF